MNVSVVVWELAADPLLGRQLSGEGVHPLAPERAVNVNVSTDQRIWTAGEHIGEHVRRGAVDYGPVENSTVR